MHTAVASIVGEARCAVVLMGPGGFDDQEGNHGWAPDTPELYRAVNDVTRRVAAAFGLPFIDRVVAADAARRTFFREGTATHYSRSGHRTLGAEVAETLLKSGLM